MNAKDPTLKSGGSSPSASALANAGTSATSTTTATKGMTIFGLPAIAVIGGMLGGLALLAWIFWPTKKKIARRKNPSPPKRKRSKR